MTTQVESVTVSIPRELIQFADQIATELQVSRSKVFTSCLRELADKRLHEATRLWPRNIGSLLM